MVLQGCFKLTVGSSQSSAGYWWGGVGAAAGRARDRQPVTYITGTGGTRNLGHKVVKVQSKKMVKIMILSRQVLN
jgi:hypothetical protein